MANTPLNHYKIDELCSFSMSKTILEVTLQPHEFKVEDIEKILTKLEEFTSGAEYRVLINCVPGARTSFAGLRALAKATAMSYATAKAYVIHTSHQRLMANLFLLLFKPNKPVKFFRDEERARRWLSELVLL